MKRSLAARSFVPAALSMTGFVVLCCLLLYSAMKRDLVFDKVREEVQLAGIVVEATRYAMLRSDRDALRSIVQNVGNHAAVEHLRIFDKKGRITFSAAPGEAGRTVDKRADGCRGCHSTPRPATSLGPMEQARQFTNERGRPVLAITAPIYNAPACIGAECHSSEQRLLGTLDIGLSRSPLQRSLSVLRGQMVLFSIMVLVLTVGWTAVVLRQGTGIEGERVPTKAT